MALQDSKLESIISEQGYTLTDVYIPGSFTDKDGTPFQAKSDAVAFKNNQLTVIEFKHGELNPHTSIKTCHNSLYTQCNYRGLFINPHGDHNHFSHKLWSNGYRKDCLKHAWNHAAKKHEIVSNELKKLGINYLVVFTHHPTMIKYRNKNTYMQNFYKFDCMHYSEFKDTFDTSDLVRGSVARQLLKQVA